MDETMHDVLAAREARWNKRLAFVSESHGSLITITLCLPVAYRTRDDFHEIFHMLCTRFIQGLINHGIEPKLVDMMAGADGPACFLSVHVAAEIIKRVCIEAEETLPGGRMLDIDVMDEKGYSVGRSEIGWPPRKCFVCNQSAVVCVSRKRHSPADVAEQVERLAMQFHSGK